MSVNIGGGRSARSLETNYETKWLLPTNRQDYIVNNPTTQLAHNHVDKNRIPPVWTKVTRTPWENSANLCGGYGRRLQNTSVSNDAPAFFFNPDRQADKFYARNPDARPVTANRRSALFKQTESAQVLPGGMNLLAASQSRPKTAGPRCRMVPYGKQTYSMEVVPAKPYKEPKPMGIPKEYAKFMKGASSARTTQRSDYSDY